MSRLAFALLFALVPHASALGACGDTPAEASSAPPSALRIGFWNVRKLGQDRAKDVHRLCALVGAHFDVLALAEIMADDDTGDVAALRACLAQDFHVLETPDARPRGAQPYREHGWLALRKARASPCHAQAALRYAEPPVIDDALVFLRPPAFGCVALPEGRELFVGVYHARWGTGEPADVAQEVSLLDDVLQALPRALGAPEDIILLGDLNLTPEAVHAASGLRTHTTGGGSTLSPGGTPTSHLYDQLLIAPSAALPLSDARVLDLRAEAGGGGAYQRTLSDHLPIVAFLDVR